MSKRPTTTGAGRTNPPDRDGDGAPGGSLPGNETVDAAKGPELIDKIIDAKDQLEASGDADAASRDAIEGRARPVADDHVHAPAAGEEAAKAEGAFVEVVVNPRLESEPLTFGVRTNIPGLVIEADTLTEAMKESHRWAGELMQEAGRTDEVLFTVSPEAVAAATDPTDGGDTFTAEEIAAGQTPVAEAEGDAEVTAAEATQAAQAELVAVEPEGQTAPPVAVRLDELRRLVDNRWLYKSEGGFSPSYSAPFVSAETVQVWLDTGLAEDRPDAGREGGVYVTAKARQAVAGRVAA